MNRILKSNNYSILVFDLDGTLYPRNIYHKDYYIFTLQSIMELFSKSEDEAKEILISGGITPDSEEPQGSVSSLMKSLGMTLKSWNHYRDSKFDVSKLILPNRRLVLDLAIMAKNFQTVLLTNNTIFSTKRILSKLGFINQKPFNLIITSDFGLELKPNSESFNYIKKTFDIQFSNMISIGDRYDVDISPLIGLGGNGILISDPSEITTIALKLTKYGWKNE